MSISEVLQRKMNRTSTTDSLPRGTLTKNLIGEKINFLVPRPIGPPFTQPPQISNITVSDLDGDGLLDVIVCDTKNSFVAWQRQYPAGVYTEIVDISNDGYQDIVFVVSQEWEEIYCFVNDGKGNFQSKLLWGSNNEDFGSSGIYICDLNKDGKPDILYTNGDAFDYIPPRGRPWHGVQWLENKGNLKFEFHRICNFIGSYSVRPADIDNDGDIDLFAVSAFNLWDKLEYQSFIWLENTLWMNNGALVQKK